MVKLDQAGVSDPARRLVWAYGGTTEIDIPAWRQAASAFRSLPPEELERFWKEHFVLGWTRPGRDALIRQMGAAAPSIPPVAGWWLIMSFFWLALSGVSSTRAPASPETAEGASDFDSLDPAVVLTALAMWCGRGPRRRREGEEQPGPES